MRLSGKTALVTGAGSGIGAACVTLFKAEGARVAGVDLNTGGLAALGEALDLWSGRAVTTTCRSARSVHPFQGGGVADDA